MNIFVVYAYCRKDGTYYYIGKGKPHRPYQWRGKRGINPPKDRSRILILHSELPEELALEYEKKLILFYGRKDLNTGLLKNRTDGGEGACGWIPSQDYREKRGEQMKKRHDDLRDVDGKSKLGKKCAANLNRKKHSERDEYGRSLAGKKSCLAKKSRPIKVIVMESGEELYFPNSVEAGLALGLNPRTLRKVATGDLDSYKGHSALYLDDTGGQRDLRLAAREKSREDSMKRQSEICKEKWKDPDYREKRIQSSSEYMLEAWRDENYRKRMSEMMKGDKNPLFGKMWITDGTKGGNKLIDKGDTIPPGYRAGMTRR